MPFEPVQVGPCVAIAVALTATAMDNRRPGNHAIMKTIEAAGYGVGVDEVEP